MNFFNKKMICLVFLLCCSLVAKTRWDALHFVPSADFLGGGQYVLEAGAYTFSDTAAKSVLNPAFSMDFGIIEWVNLEFGYAGGPTMGFKARILNESGNFFPSMAIGVHNIVTNRDVGLFSARDTIPNEVFVAFSKSIDPLKMCVHLGMQSVPTSKTEMVNPYVAIEEYFGKGIYASAEVFSRAQTVHPSLFVSWRFLKKQFEVSAGAVDINKLFFDQNNQFQFALGNKNPDSFVKPGIWFGLRYSGNLGFSKAATFTTLEDRVNLQGDVIRQLSLQVDSMKKNMSDKCKIIEAANTKIMRIADSMTSDNTKLKPLLIEKINVLKTAYAEEPFDPDRVRRLKNEFISQRETATPVLRELLLDKTLDKRVRLLSVELLGDIGNANASDVLLDVLSQTQDPDIKIEICIALGKIKETRAVYVLEQLANDPVDPVAFAAQEVLIKLAKNTGIRLSADVKMRKVAASDSVTVPDTRIKTLPVKDTVASSVAKSQPKPIPAATTNRGFIAPKSPREPSEPKLPVVKEPAPQQVPVVKSSRPTVTVDSAVKTKNQQDSDVWQPDSVHAADSLKATAAPAVQAKSDSTKGFLPPNKSVAPGTKTPVSQKKQKKTESAPVPEDNNW